MKDNSTNPAADVIVDMILKNILLSLAIFYAMKLINKSYSKKEIKAMPDIPNTKEKLLIEIHRLLKE